jgi:hypothetical protein
MRVWTRVVAAAGLRFPVIALIGHCRIEQLG